MTAWDTVVDDLRRENLDRSYLEQPTATPDPLMQVIGILAGLLATGRRGHANTREDYR